MSGNTEESREAPRPGEADVARGEGQEPEERTIEAGSSSGGPTPEEIEKERDQLRDRLLRLTAEFDNFRKRIRREQVEWTARAVETVVHDLLPALDSFDRALTPSAEAKEASALREGMILVHKQLLGALKTHGIEPFTAVGEPFDPNLHDAFMSRPAKEGEVPGTIVEEFVKGYRMGSRTIRPAKGIVAALPEDGPGTAPAPEEE